jgi:hypothetical protein
MSAFQNTHFDKQSRTFYFSHLGSFRGYLVEPDPQPEGTPPMPPPPDALALKSELGMPEGAVWRRLFAKGGVFGERWRGYDIVFFGMLVNDSDQLEGVCPLWRIKDKSGEVLETIQLWYQKVSHKESPVSCEIRWHPEKGESLDFPGLGSAKREYDITLAWRGKALLQKVAKLGRSNGSSNLTRAEFEERAPKAYRKWVDMFGGEPTDVQFAEELGVSRATLYRYMTNYGVKMPQIRAKAMNL